MCLSKGFSVGERVRLRSFRGTALSPIDIRKDNNYWLLIGITGTVVDTDDVSKVGRHVDGPRLLVLFDRDVAELGLHCHNEAPNTLWIFASDLAAEERGGHGGARALEQ